LQRGYITDSAITVVVPYYTTHRPCVGTTKNRIQWVLEAVFQGVERPTSEGGHPYFSIVEI